MVLLYGMSGDTEGTELKALFRIDWEGQCGVNRQYMYDSFARHDNDFGSHVFLPYLFALFIGPFPSIVLAYLYESSAALERIYDMRVLHSRNSYTGIIDGLLQDPLAAFIGAFALSIHASVLQDRVSIRNGMLNAYGVQWSWDAAWNNAAFLAFTFVPLCVGHNLYEPFGATMTEVPWRVWTMCLSFILPLLHALYIAFWRKTAKDARDAYICLGLTFACILVASILSYNGFRQNWPDPAQSTCFWILIMFLIEFPIIWLLRRSASGWHYFTLT